MGIAPPQNRDLGLMEERNKICLQSNPPKCFYEDELYKDPLDPHPLLDQPLFDLSESGGIKNKVFDKSTIRQGGFTKPSELDLMDIREILRRNEEKFKAESPLGALGGTALGSPLTASGQGIKDGIKDLEAEYLVPDYLKQKLREMEWKRRLEEERNRG